MAGIDVRPAQLGGSGGVLSRLLRHAPPAQYNPTIVNVPTGGGDYSGSPFGANEDVTFVLPSGTVTDTIRWKGGRHVRMIGGTFHSSDSASNYMVVGQQVSGSFFAEGLEFPDQTGGNWDVIDVCGDWSGSTQGFAPDIYLQNIRCIGIRGDNSVNHADFFQPQGVIGRLHADKITVASNYDVYTIAADSCNNVPPRGVFMTRHNTWWDAANAVDPYTSPYWLNSATGVANKDTMPFPIIFGEGMYCDPARGAGRNFAGKIENAFWPQHSTGKAGGGTLRNLSDPSPFAANEVIGATDNADHSAATFTNPRMMFHGWLRQGSPPSDRPDVTLAADGRADFVPAGIGTNYRSPGYLPSAPELAIVTNVLVEVDGAYPPRLTLDPVTFIGATDPATTSIVLDDDTWLGS